MPPTAPASSAAAAAAADHPRTLHPTALRLQGWRRRCAHLMEGSDAVKENAEACGYLPRFGGPDGEDTDTYRARRDLTPVFDGFERAVQVSAALLTSRAPQLAADVPGLVRAHLETVDGANANLTVFARRIAADAMGLGYGGVLVDFPTAPARADGQALTIADEQALNLRPVWSWYRATDINSWRPVREGARTVLAQLVLHETGEVEEGTYGSKVEDRWRVLRRVLGDHNGDGVAPYIVTWELMAERLNATTKKVELLVIEAGICANQDEIPFAPLIAGHDSGFWDVKPPMLTLADLNIYHWRVSTARAWNLALGGVPVPVRTGYVDRKGQFASVEEDWEVGKGATGAARAIEREQAQKVQRWGPNMMMDLPVGGTFDWKCAPLDAQTPLKDEIRMTEGRMGAVSFRFMFADDRAGAETATAWRMDAAPQYATLGAVAMALRDCIELALFYHARYLGHLANGWAPKVRARMTPAEREASEAYKDGGTVTINTDFAGTVLAPEMLRVLNEMATAGNLPQRVLFLLMQRGNVLPEGEDPEKLVREIMLQLADADKATAGDPDPDEDEDEDEDEDVDEDEGEGEG